MYKTFWMAPIILVLQGAAGAQPPVPLTEPEVFGDAPDACVTYIERTPRYPAYTLSYDAPGKRGLAVPTHPKTGQVMSEVENAAMQRWPKAGEKVTYTVHVVNKGQKEFAPFPYRWLYNGKVVQSGKHTTPLLPGAEATQTFEMPWEKGLHTVEFQVDPYFTLPDRFLANNRLAIHTDAMAFLWAVDKVTYEGFNKVRNFLGTYSFEDWANWHVRQMNELIRTSPSPIQPDGGGRTRVRADKILVLDDLEKEWEPLGGPFGKLSAGYDGSWPFGRNPDVRNWASRPDWGLIHEWAHQLGLTDEYGLDRPASENLVPDDNGDPLLLGRMSPLLGYMMHGHGPVPFSPECSAALEIQYRQDVRRRGYYGDYYYDTPEQTVLRIMDNAGKPVPQARITAYQRGEETEGVFREPPTFVVTTNARGEAVLPNRDAPHHQTDRGFTLHPNPFGKINVVGTNGVLFMKVQARGQTDYIWMDITELNLAFWQGQKKRAVFTKSTHIPPVGAPAAPRDLRAETTDDGVRLSWQADSPVNVYRAAPDRAEYERIAENISGRTFEEKSPGGGLYHYAITTSGSRESGFSNVVGAMRLVNPWGIAVTPDGKRYIRDRGFEQTVLQKADGGFIGRIGSVHMHYEGSDDLAIDGTGRLYMSKKGDGYSPQVGFRIHNAAADMMLEHRKPAGMGPQDFTSPAGITVTRDGVFFIADSANRRVSVWKSSARDNGRRMDATHLYNIENAAFTEPVKPVIDELRRRLYVTDAGANAIHVFDWASGQTPDTGTPVMAATWTPGLNKPLGMSLDGKGGLLVSDSGKSRVVTLDAHGNVVSEWTGPSEAPLKEPRGVGATPDGRIVVVDGGRRRVLTQ